MGNAGNEAQKKTERLDLIETSLRRARSRLQSARNAAGETDFPQGGAEDETLTSIIDAVESLVMAVDVIRAEVFARG